MTKFGLVTAYNEKTGRATVSYVRPDACAKCGACGILNKSGKIELKADCRVGQWVRVELPDGKFMSASLLAYLFPLCGFLLGLFSGYLLSGHSELWALAGAVIGLAVPSVILYIVEKHIAGKPEWTPRICAVYDQKPDMDEIGCGGLPE